MAPSATDTREIARGALPETSSTEADRRVCRVKDTLTAARERHLPRLTQKQLAEAAVRAGAAKLTASRISQLEHGYADASWNEVVALANVLGIRPEELARPVSPVPSKPAAEPAPAPIGISAASARQRPEETPGPKSVPPPPAAPPLAAPPAEDLPPALPIQGDRSNLQYHQELTALLGRAEKKLHQTGLSAPAWRAWRALVLELKNTLKSVSL